MIGLWSSSTPVVEVTHRRAGFREDRPGNGRDGEHKAQTGQQCKDFHLPLLR